MNETRRTVLEALAEGPVSGPELAERLDVSRAAVWKHVQALREDGFEIESGDGGYRLVDVPEYNGPAIEYGLEAPFTVDFSETVESTNDRARRLAADGRTDVAVVADEQTGGRGRLDREWSSPPGGIWLSVLCRPNVPPAKAPLYTLAAAVATTDAAREAGVDARIKWPNDVVVPADDERGYRKLAGVLTEMEGETDRVGWLVVGVGVNANVDAEDVPPGATTLRAERLGRNAAVDAGDDASTGDVDRRAFVQRLLETFDRYRRDLDSVVPAWLERALTIGRRVRVDVPDGPIVGEAVDVTATGALVVETDEGRRTVSAGDCEHVRPDRGSRGRSASSGPDSA